MQTECHKCGAPTTQGEPFCGRCGAVIGMRDSARRPEDASPSFAPTVAGKPPKAARAAAKQSPRPTQTQTKTPTTAGANARDGGGALYFVVGFVAVLLLLLLLWLWTNAGG
jgi:hypothetical protein